MAFSRYARDRIRSDGQGKRSASAIATIRTALKAGQISPVRTIVSTQADRLDTIAGEIYGDGQYWWVVAIGSGIGWGMQVPPGTIINILDLKDIERLVG